MNSSGAPGPGHANTPDAFRRGVRPAPTLTPAPGPLWVFLDLGGTAPPFQVFESLPAAIRWSATA